MTSRRIWVVVGTLSLAAAACGGSDGPTATPTTPAPAPTTQAPATTAAPTTDAPATTEPDATTVPPTAPAGGVSSYQDVQGAVIQIEAIGSFRSPEIGWESNAGRGSGFFISPDGYAVTNNHVVTGAGTLEIFIGGDDNESYNARIVGASECNDLALIKVDVDGEVPFLQWADGDPTVGEPIYVAGFPLGDPEYSLTRGIVQKADADGETSWASIRRSVQLDVSAQPGNSGGPVVTESGEVAAVYYAYNDATNERQQFAISNTLAASVVETLMDGDFQSLGINGSAVWDETLGISGVWVAAVKAGSPASAVGLKPGDIITAMNGVALGTKGTMEEYCDVIRTAGEGAPMAIQVLSWDDRAVYEGEINNPDKKLVAVATFDDPSVAEGTGYTYAAVSNNDGELWVEVPDTWLYDDRDDGAKASIWASPDFSSFLSTWSTPGMKLTVFPAEDTHTVADMYNLLAATDFLQSDCSGYSGPQEYDDGWFIGVYGQWSGCGSNSAGYLMLSTVDPASARLVTMEFQYVTQADLDAAAHGLQTFTLT